MAHHKIVISGTNAIGDAFQFGFSVDTEVSGSTLQQTVDAVKTSFDQKWAGSQPSGGAFKDFFTSGTTFSKVTGYARPLDPTGDATDVAEATFSGKVGEGTGSSLPAEASTVVSLLTGQPGKRRRGRMYLPAMTAGSLATDGKLSTSRQESTAQWAAAFLGDVNDGFKFACVWSRTNMALYRITGVVVGNQVDVQTRRQNAIPETYYTQSVSQV